MNTPENKRSERSRDEVLAGEYVLGVLPAKARQEVELRLANDKTFASMVDRWESNLAEFNDGFGPELVPSPKVLADIERELFAFDQVRARPSLWNSVTLWRGLTLISLAAALLFLVTNPKLF